MNHPHECDGCPLRATSQGFVPNMKVRIGQDLCVWGEMPGADEAKVGEPFVGRSGALLRGALKMAKRQPGWAGDPTSRRDVAYLNVVSCRQPNNIFPGARAANHCMHRLGTAQGLEQNQHLVCGANAVEALSGWRPQMTKKRGSLLWLDVLQSWGVVTLHPAFLVRGGDEAKGQEQLYPKLVIDTKRAEAAVKPRVPTIHLSDPHTVLGAWRQRPRETEAVSFDVEGAGGVLSMVGLSWQVGEAWVLDPTQEAFSAVAEILGDPRVVPVAHNAPYDIIELEMNGVPRPKRWFDTMNEAAVYDPGVPMGLESQVLSHVPGSHEWKSLIDHKRGHDFDGGEIGLCRERWSHILDSLGRRVPANSLQWFKFYNGLDTAWGLELHMQLKRWLGPVRWRYYLDYMMPLQSKLLVIGERGLVVDQKRLEWHQRACRRLVASAQKGLGMGQFSVLAQVSKLRSAVHTHEVARAQEKAAGARAYSQAKELTKLRTQLRTVEKQAQGGFDFESAKQKRDLLYGELGLPEVHKKGTKAATTDQPAIESLLSRLERATIKPAKEHRNPSYKDTNGNTRYPQVEKTLRSLAAASKWSSWLGTFLKDRPTGRIITTYSMHRNLSGRLTSGTDDTELEQKKKRTNLQNVPKPVRDIIVGRFVQADWKALHWSIVMWQSHLLDPGGIHLDLLQRQQAGQFDPHRYLASIAFQVAEHLVTKEQRQWAKAFTFGRMYLGAATTLGRKKGIPDKISKLVCDAHETAFKLKKWQDATLALAKSRTCAKRGAFVESPTGGWRRYFWSVEPKATDVLATTVLAAESDMLKWCVKEIPAQPREDAPGYLVTNTHDSIMIESTGLSMLAKEWLCSIMERPVPFIQDRIFKTEGDIGKNWKEVS